MLPQSGDYETGNANLDRLDSRTLQWTPEGLLEASADWLPWSPNPCKTSCAFLPAHTEAPKSLASHRKFLSGCLLITFSVYISLPFIQGNSASSIYREPLQSSRFWCGWGPAGENIPQGPSLWGFWQWSHPSKLDRGPLISVLKGWRQRLPRNPRSSVNEANGSRWPQWTWETRVSRNWVFTKYWGWKWSPATEIELDTTGKDAIFRRDLALVKSREKNKTHFSGFPTRGTDRKKKNRKKKKKGKMLICLLQTRSMERFMWFCSEPRPVPSFCSSEGMEGSTEKENNTSWFHVLLERSPGWIEFTWSTGVRHWKYLRICYIQIWQGDGGRIYVS